jgi:hypothetical protein
MRLAFAISPIAATVLTLAGSFAAAQSGCTESFTEYTAYCGSSNGCSDSVDYTLASDPGLYGVPFYCNTIYCRGQGLPNCYQLTGYCQNMVKLADPGVRQRLLELARSEDLMVATCGGRYLPLSAALGEDAPPAFRPRRTFARLTGSGE